MNKTITKKGLKNPNFKSFWSKVVGNLGRIGKALLFPIAVLPIAAILLRIGAQVPTGTPFSQFVQSIIFHSGNVIFSNLPILFAIGVGFGLTKDNRGEAALAAFVGMALLSLLMKSNGADLPLQIYRNLQFPLAPGVGSDAAGFHRIFGKSYDAILGDNVLNGIIAGAFVAWIYNTFNQTSLPNALGFFSGRRLVPVLTVLGILCFGLIYAVIYPWIGYGIYRFSVALTDATGNRYSNAGIMGTYVFLNRLLLPFGLHHIPNTLFWFQFGAHQDALGNTINGDINIFIQGVALGNKAGTFQSGFFPMMMFGLPALVGAIYFSADNKTQKMRVLTMLGGASFVALLTGITEPLEFAFMFVALPLYLMHAILGGFFAFVTGLFGIQLGFGFSAGLFDYLLSIPKSIEIINANLTGFGVIMANPGWIIPIGILAANCYFWLGGFLIKKFNFQTPGRGTNHISLDEAPTIVPKRGQISIKTAQIIIALGGWDNITNYQHCATRLRYDVVDAKKVDEKTLKKLGALGVIKVSKHHIQIIIGPKVEMLNNEIVNFKGVDLSLYVK